MYIRADYVNRIQLFAHSILFERRVGVAGRMARGAIRVSPSAVRAVANDQP